MVLFHALKGDIFRCFLLLGLSVEVIRDLRCRMSIEGAFLI
jgi:hypothetical protein